MLESIYSGGTLLSPESHKHLTYTPSRKLPLVSSLSSAPLTVSEFRQASREFPIFFADVNTGIAPIALLGLSPGENLFLNGQGAWTGDYIPALFRQLPFFSTAIRDTGQVALSVLPQAKSLTERGGGIRLFTDGGKATEFLDIVTAFTSGLFRDAVATQTFCDELQNLDVLEPSQARITLPDQKNRRLNGFKVVSRDKLSALSDKQIALMSRNGFLEAIHLHWASIFNLENLGNMALDRPVKANRKSDRFTSIATMAGPLS